MTIYVTADTHFQHQNIIKFNPATRKYANAAEMDAALINEWNQTVLPEDTVYILGDFSFGHVNRAIEIAEELNGKKILIKGNHDGAFLRNRKFREQFVQVTDYLDLKYNDISVIMFHYPILLHRNAHKNPIKNENSVDYSNVSVHLHGHVHGATTGLEKYRVKDVGVDATSRVVSKLDDVIAEIINNQPKLKALSNV